MLTSTYRRPAPADVARAGRIADTPIARLSGVDLDWLATEPGQAALAQLDRPSPSCRRLRRLAASPFLTAALALSAVVSVTVALTLDVATAVALPAVVTPTTARPTSTTACPVAIGDAVCVSTDGSCPAGVR